MQPTVTLGSSFSNFFLLHDFFQRFCRLPPTNPSFFDVQFHIHQKVKTAAHRGARTLQVGLLFGLVGYCLKGNNKLFKMVSGILYVRWLQHFYTLGSYGGVLMTIPSISRQTEDYYQKHPEDTNYLERVKKEMNKHDDSQIDKVLDQIFPRDNIKEKPSFVENNFFEKHRDAFFEGSDQNGKDKVETHDSQRLKLRYLDSFLTRYIYHNFTRWFWQVRKNWGI